MVVLIIWSALSKLLFFILQIVRVLGDKPHHHIKVADHGGEVRAAFIIITSDN